MKHLEKVGFFIIMAGTSYGAVRSGMFGKAIFANEPLKIKKGIWWDICEFEEYQEIYIRPHKFINEFIVVDSITKDKTITKLKT